MRWADSLALVREHGPGWVTRRGAWEIALRSGIMARRLPARPAPGAPGRPAATWMPGRSPEALRAQVLLGERRFFLPDSLDVLRDSIADPHGVITRAEDLLRGRMVLFAHRAWEVGHPPDWFRSPLTGARWPPHTHWAAVEELSPEHGDIKAIWETARFGQTFLLARAFALTGDERYAEAFFAQVEHWIAANPPETGPHWRCGQEVSLRLLAWVFGLHAFVRTGAASAPRVAHLVESIRDHARHVEAVHGFAVHCLRNNHAISEAAALFTAGTLFPFFPESGRWRRIGLRSLARETWQVCADGSYVQHSPNYGRMVAQVYSWVLALCAGSDSDPPAAVVASARRLLRFLTGLQDATSGALPNCGPNDGTLLLPLASCDYVDYRPALDALSVLLGAGSLYGPGPWEEEAAWLGGARVDAGSPSGRAGAGAPVAFPDGGYYRLNGRGTHGVIRCGAYKHRPHQADMLHLDIWCGGQNILADAGTYLYNTAPSWSGYFTGTAAHNTVTVDGRDQMRRGGRFLWHDWVAGRIEEHRVIPRGAIFRGHHEGYRPVRHTRRVIVHDDLWLVIDDLTGGDRDHEFRLHWLVPVEQVEPDARGGTILPVASSGAPPAGADQAGRSDAGAPPAALRLECRATGDPAGSWERGNERVPRGWHAPYYGERTPAWSYALIARGRAARFVTLLGPAHSIGSLLPLDGESGERLAAQWERAATDPAAKG